VLQVASLAWKAGSVPVHVDQSADLFALEADLKVVDLEALKPYVGDVVNGLATGLTGNRDAVVEGLAINVVDNARAPSGLVERPASRDRDGYS